MLDYYYKVNFSFLEFEIIRTAGVVSRCYQSFNIFSIRYYRVVQVEKRARETVGNNKGTCLNLASYLTRTSESLRNNFCFDLIKSFVVYTLPNKSTEKKTIVYIFYNDGWHSRLRPDGRFNLRLRCGWLFGNFPYIHMH